MASPKKPADVGTDIVRHPGEVVHSIAPKPTPTTLWSRTFVPYQVYRFARVNLRMVKMIRRGHEG